MSVRITDKVSSQYKNVVKELTKGGLNVGVGIFAAEGSEQYDTGSTVLGIGTIHEFGAGPIPERSFIRAYIDENQDRIMRMAAKLHESVAAGSMTREAALEKLGLKMAGEIQARISDGIPPALAPATIDRKGSDTPLIDTGQLRASITHKVGV